ncbi:PHP domain-containing protein [Verrucomicrobiota bacterium]
MRSFRYDDAAGKWFKGNTHIHTTASDGGMGYDEVAELYAGGEYNFLFATDHWAASDMAPRNGDAPLLWLDGIELDGQGGADGYYHVVCLGRFEGIESGMGLAEAMQVARAQDGILILAHPYWCANSFADAFRWRFDGVEIYNHVCRWLNGKGMGAVHWNAMLARDPNILGFAVDDAHLRPEHPSWNGGWIHVNAEECTPQAVVNAIRKGRYYSSCGPEIEAIEYRDGMLTVKTSPVRHVRLVGPGSRGARVTAPEDEALEQTDIPVPEGWPYVYLELEDHGGQCAWTNGLFVEE